MKNCDGDEEDKRDKLKSRALLQFSSTILAVNGVDFWGFLLKKICKIIHKESKNNPTEHCTSIDRAVTTCWNPLNISNSIFTSFPSATFEDGIFSRKYEMSSCGSSSLKSFKMPCLIFWHPPWIFFCVFHGNSALSIANQRSSILL